MIDGDDLAPVQPPEPDWDALLKALDAARRWFLFYDEYGALELGAIDLASDLIGGIQAEQDHDALVRQFFERVNHVAFWAQGSCEDAKLTEWVRRFCPDTAREWAHVEKVNAVADCKGTA